MRKQAPERGALSSISGNSQRAAFRSPAKPTHKASENIATTTAKLKPTTHLNDGTLLHNPLASPLNTLGQRKLKLSPKKPSSAKPQRSLKLAQVDSLLLNDLVCRSRRDEFSSSGGSLEKGDGDEYLFFGGVGGGRQYGRTSPMRKATADVKYKIFDEEEDRIEDPTKKSNTPRNQRKSQLDTDWDPRELDSASSPGDETFEDAMGWQTPTKPRGSKSTAKLQSATKETVTFGPFDLETSMSKLTLLDEIIKQPSRTLPKNPLLTTIKFTPPTQSSPTKLPQIRPSTPSPVEPSTPTRSPSKTSPKKTFIPPTPLYSTHDNFWDAEAVNSWNETYSPRKVLKSPRKIPLPDRDDSASELSSIDEPWSPVKSSSPRKGGAATPAKHRAKTALAERKAFDAIKEDVASSFMAELDNRITNGEIVRLTAATGGVKLIWSKKLHTTAGRANWRREAVRQHAPSSTTNASATASPMKPAVTHRHTASIELSSKVITDTPRLLNVVAHEFCHLANFMVSGIKDQPHGASFQEWARKVTSHFAHRDVEVTTKHTYEIEYRFAWACIGTTVDKEDACGQSYERHSRSIDPARHTCGKCRGRLEQIRPVPRAVSPAKKGPGGEVKSAYQVFVKEHFSMVKKELGPKSPMKDVMRELGVRYRESKDRRSDIAVSPQQSKGEKEVVLDVVEISDMDGDGEGDDDEEKSEVDGVARVLDFLSIREARPV